MPKIDTFGHDPRSDWLKKAENIEMTLIIRLNLKILDKKIDSKVFSFWLTNAEVHLFKHTDLLTRFDLESYCKCMKNQIVEF